MTGGITFLIQSIWSTVGSLYVHGHLFLSFFKIYLFIISKYTVAVFRHSGRGSQISFRMVMSHHVVAGIWTPDLRESSRVLLPTEPCLQPLINFSKDLLCIQRSSSMYARRPEQGTRSHYRWLWATMWLLGIELRTSGRAASALNRWAISPACFHSFLIQVFCFGIRPYRWETDQRNGRDLLQVTRS